MQRLKRIAILQTIAPLSHALRKKSIFKIKVILQFWLVHHTATIVGMNVERFNDHNSTLTQTIK